MAKISSTALLSLLAVLATGSTTSRYAQGFVARSSTLLTSPLRPAFVSFRGGEAAATAAATATASSSEFDAEEVPSWESLESDLEKIRNSDVEETKPVLTFYR